MKMRTLALILMMVCLSACAPTETDKTLMENSATVEKADGPVIPDSYQIYFDWDKAVLDAEGLNRLHDVTKKLMAGQKPYGLTLNGHADASGEADYNMELSERRAETVEKLMAGLGIPETLISVYAFGETDLAVPTADGVREPLNRRVEIFIEK